MSDTEIKKGETWVNRLDENNTATLATVGAISVEGSSAKDGNYMAPKPDPVNSPSHYTSDPSGVHCIEIAENWDFLLGNTLKYMWRHGKKSTSDSIEDLEKARWYLDRKIKKLKSERRVSLIGEYTDRESEGTFTSY